MFHLILYNTKLLSGNYSVVQITLKTMMLVSVSPVSGHLPDSVTNTTVVTQKKLGITKLALPTF